MYVSLWDLHADHGNSSGASSRGQLVDRYYLLDAPWGELRVEAHHGRRCEDGQPSGS